MGGIFHMFGNKGGGLGGTHGVGGGCEGESIFDMFNGMGIGQMGGRPQKAARYDVLPEGTPVIIQGVHSQPQLNGQVAEVQDFQDDRKRYTVTMQNTDQTFALAADKLQQVVEGVRIADLASEPNLNGQEGILVGYDKDSGRFRVQTSNKVVALKPNNVVLPNDIIVEIVGVQKQPELNGHRGKIVSYDPVAQRYNVQMRDSEIKQLRQVNVRPG